MILAELMVLENIDDYYVWWYGMTMPADYFTENGFSKEYLDVQKGADI